MDVRLGRDRVDAGRVAVVETWRLFLLRCLARKEDPWKEPGNFGDPLNLGMYDRDMRNRELNNGRFAMPLGS